MMQILKKMGLVGFIIMMSLLTACGGGENDASDIIATEKWHVIMDQGQGTSQWTIKKKSDGTMLVEGEFVYSYDGYPGRCPFVDGEVTILDDAFTMSASGTATYNNPNIPSAYQTSPFTLFVDGSSGAYWISFTQTGWPSTYTGTGQPYLVEGGGITEEPDPVYANDISGRWRLTDKQTYDNYNQPLDPAEVTIIEINQADNTFTITGEDGETITGGTVDGTTYRIRIELDDSTHNITLQLVSDNAFTGTNIVKSITTNWEGHWELKGEKI